MGQNSLNGLVINTSVVQPSSEATTRKRASRTTRR